MKTDIKLNKICFQYTEENEIHKVSPKISGI